MAVSDLTFEHKVRQSSGDRRHKHCQEVQEWVRLGCERM
jgi:hypothetical protein